MPRLYGREWTRAELLARVGRIEQVGGIRASTLAGGRASGVRALDFDCGDGMRFTVLPDLCMDIPALSYRGIPLVWSANNGIVAPQYFNPEGEGFARSFFGGLVTTCGLTQVGQPCVDDGEYLGLHGRIGNTPATEVSASGTWDGDAYTLSARGTMRESKIMADDLLLTREIRTQLGARRIHLHDRVENLSGERAPFMILYHCNTGFPVLGPEARFLVSTLRVEPKDDRSRAALPEFNGFAPPTPGWQELNYWVDVRPGADSWCAAAIVNDQLAIGDRTGIGLAIRWRKDQLWNLVHWKELAHGNYVSAMEPANCHTLGRCKERELGTLQHIEPGEVREFDVIFEVLVGTDAIAEFEASLPR